jgi:hypothetical protein
MSFGDLAQALALAAVALDSGTVQYQWVSADMMALDPGAPHAGAHSFDNQVSFQLGNGAIVQKTLPRGNVTPSPLSEHFPLPRGIRHRDIGRGRSGCLRG